MAVPPGVLTNADLSHMLDTSDEWIVERTGIRERRIAAAGPDRRDAEPRGERAGARAAGVHRRRDRRHRARHGHARPPAPVDRVRPAGAARRRQAPRPSISVPPVPGYIYALTVAEGLIASGQSDTVLVVGAEKLSTITDFQDRSTAILFGDGAGASVVRRARRGRAAASSRPSSSPTAGSRRCSTVPAAAPPIRSARRSSASGPTT